MNYYKWEFDTFRKLIQTVPRWKKWWYAFIKTELYVRSYENNTWINSNSILKEYVNNEIEETKCLALAYSIIL